MSRGKSVPVGPTAKLPQGESWEQLANMTPADIRQRGLFPYPPLLHQKQTPDSQVCPQMQTAIFPHLERFDVEFDLPEAFPSPATHPVRVLRCEPVACRQPPALANPLARGVRADPRRGYQRAGWQLGCMGWADAVGGKGRLIFLSPKPLRV